MAGLTNKQRAFTEHYLQTWNGTEAARRAKYKGGDNVLAVTANRLLRNDKVRAAIEARLSSEAMSANEVLWRLGDQARADIGEFVDIDPETQRATLNLAKAEAAGKLHLVKKLKHNAKGDPEIELYDQQAALVHLGKHHGLFVETYEHNVTVFDLEEWGNKRAERLAQVAQMSGPGPDDAAQDA